MYKPHPSIMKLMMSGCGGVDKVTMDVREGPRSPPHIKKSAPGPSRGRGRAAGGRAGHQGPPAALPWPRAGPGWPPGGGGGGSGAIQRPVGVPGATESGRGLHVQTPPTSLGYVNGSDY